MADYQIGKATGVLKTQIRKIENDLTVSIKKIYAKIERESKHLDKIAKADNAILDEKIDEEALWLKKAISR
jgi:hypothetical protein